MNFVSKKSFFRFVLFPAVAALATAACGDSSDNGGAAGGAGAGGGPSGTDLVIHGRVLEAGSNGSQGSPLSDVDVSAGIDLNKDGKLAENELVHVATDDNGDYSVGVAVSQGDRVVMAYRYDGLAPQYRTVVAGGNGDAVLNVALNELKQLTCTGGACAVEGNSLRIDGLPDGASGSAKVFNPVTQPEAFPGGFEESTGKLLISGVFSAVELTDSNGGALHDLPAPATLRMTMPIDTWGIVTDIQPGTDRVEVPLYAFDENLGTWVRDGEGHLEDSTGAIIPESDLASIRDGSYAGTVVATGEVNHFSYWNVDWPIDSHGCVSALVLDADGNPAAGATVSVRGTTYNGTSSPQTTGPDGRFCVDVMRSEGAGEDVDQDGILGETQNVAIRVSYQGKAYDAGAFDVGQEQATCAEGGCTDLGEIRLTADKMLQVTLCTLTGTARDIAGNPVVGAMVYAYDETIDADILATVCGQYNENCTYYATSADDGTFTVTTGMLDAVSLWAYSSTSDDPNHSILRYGERWMARCPADTMNLTLDQGYDNYTLTVTVTGDQITWTPNIPVNLLYVTDSVQSTNKWMVAADDGKPGFISPMTYGTVPADASQVAPYGGGAPDALASGDTVQIMATTGTTPDGYMIIGTGTGTVP